MRRRLRMTNRPPHLGPFTDDVYNAEKWEKEVREVEEAMGKKQAQKKKDAKAKKQLPSNQKSQSKKGKRKQMSYKDELDKTRAAQANRPKQTEYKDTGSLRGQEIESDNKAGPGTVQNPDDITKQVNPEGEVPKAPDQVAAEAREAGESLSTSTDKEGKVVQDEDSKKDNE